MRPVTYYADQSKPKPYLRGVSHQYGFFVSIVLALYLLYVTPTESLVPIALYCFGFCGMLGTSSSYHRLKWTIESEIWIRRLDYVMISVMIAGCFTPFAGWYFRVTTVHLYCGHCGWCRILYSTQSRLGQFSKGLSNICIHRTRLARFTSIPRDTGNLRMDLYNLGRH